MANLMCSCIVLLSLQSSFAMQVSAGGTKDASDEGGGRRRGRGRRRVSMSTPATPSPTPAPIPAPTSEGSLQDLGKIPKYIWVTGQWKSDSAEVEDQMARNIGDQPLERRRILNKVQAQVQEYYAKWAPIGSYIRYFTDEDMDDSVRNISTMLAERGINDVAKGYFNLRPGAYRADVWRLMQLWAEGGVYLDANLNLTCSLNDWIDFSNDELVLVADTGVRDGFWNAMMAAEPRNQYIESAIAHISRQVLAHYYGDNTLSITGPDALGSSVRKHQGYPQGCRSVLQWKGGNVSNTITGAVVARKDGKLHSLDASMHYAPMWKHKQVYCDQKGPVPDHGKCPKMQKKRGPNHVNKSK